MKSLRQDPPEVKQPLPEWLETAALAYATRMGLDADARGVLTHLGLPRLERWGEEIDPVSVFVCRDLTRKDWPAVVRVTKRLNLDYVLLFYRPPGAALGPKGTWS